MTRLKRVYLAGPDVFLPDALEIAARKKRLCLEYGFEGLVPIDNSLQMKSARAIYLNNVGLMQAADFIIAHLTPFRGPSADVGTVFELGMMVGMGKPALGYTNDGRHLLDRLRERDEVTEGMGKEPPWQDRAGMRVEDFGLFDNLMIACCLQELGMPIVCREIAPAQRYTDLEGFIECLRLARQRWPNARG
jgi:nucleoside 2-deoxyribosyltransferase